MESHILCCPSDSNCFHAGIVTICPSHTFACSPSLHGGCCPVGFSCAQLHCLEYEYKTLAAFGSIQTIQQQYPPQVPVAQIAASSPSSHILQPAKPAYSINPTKNPQSHGTSLACAAHETICEPSIPMKNILDLPIGERTWGKPTAWSAKIGEVAISQGIGQHRGAKSMGERFIRLLGRLIAVAAIMIVF